MQPTTKHLLKLRLPSFSVVPPSLASRAAFQHGLPVYGVRTAKGGRKQRNDKSKDRKEATIDTRNLPELEEEYQVHLDQIAARNSSVGVTLVGEKDYREGEQLDISTMQLNQDKAVEKLRLDLKPIMGQLGTSMPTCASESALYMVITC